MSIDERDLLLQRLSARVDELEREIAMLRSGPDGQPAPVAAVPATVATSGRTSRRGLLRVVAGAVATTGAASLVGSHPASARSSRGADPQMAPSFVAMGASAGGDSGLTGLDASAPSAGFATGVSGAGTNQRRLRGQRQQRRSSRAQRLRHRGYRC